MNALVVEDVASLKNWLTSYLGRKGYKVFNASSGQEAISQFNSVPFFDLALVDNKLEGKMQGTEVVAKLLNDDKAKKIVMISAYPPNETVEQLKKRGVGFLAKPYTSKKFFSSLGMNNQERKDLIDVVFQDSEKGIESKVDNQIEIQEQEKAWSNAIDHAEKNNERITAVVPLDTYHQFENAIIAKVSEIQGKTVAFDSRVESAFREISNISNSQLELRDRITTLETLFKKSDSDFEKKTLEIRHNDSVGLGKKSANWTIAAVLIALLSIILNIILTILLNWDKIFSKPQ